jgi:hypothetical protein
MALSLPRQTKRFDRSSDWMLRPLPLGERAGVRGNTAWHFHVATENGGSLISGVASEAGRRRAARLHAHQTENIASLVLSKTGRTADPSTVGMIELWRSLGA